MLLFNHVLCVFQWPIGLEFPRLFMDVGKQMRWQGKTTMKGVMGWKRLIKKTIVKLKWNLFQTTSRKCFNWLESGRKTPNEIGIVITWLFGQPRLSSYEDF